MTAREISYDDAKAEQAFVASVCPAHPGRKFNDDPACFARYCDLQQARIEPRYHQIACDIRHTAKIARMPETWHHRRRVIGKCPERYDAYNHKED
jgi:hypothetical protein